MTCPHLVTGNYPFEVEFVLDDYLGLADAIVRCKTCKTRYLLNLIDWVTPKLHERTFSVRLVDDDVFQRFAHNVSRDYCDLTRKGAEVHALTTASKRLGGTITLNVDTTQLVRMNDDPGRRPTQPWRNRLMDV